MLVSHRHRFIYTKTGKTGGTSVEMYFEPYCLDREPRPCRGEFAHYEHVSELGIVGFRGPKRPPESQWWNHMSAADIKRQIGDEIWNSYFKFCTVRNPFDRLISRFFHLRAARKIDIDTARPDHAQFEQWLHTRARGGGDRNRYLIEGKFCLDDVIRFERLHADMERMCDRFGLPWNPAAFPHAKRGLRPEGATIASMYTDTAEAIVRKQYAFEFDLFGYADSIDRAHVSETAELASSV